MAKTKRKTTPTKAPKKGPGTAVTRTGAKKRPRAPAILADLKTADGCAVSVRVGERSGDQTDCAESGTRVITTIGLRAKRGRSPRVSPRACAAMAAIGHPMRARLLSKLLEGPATYQTLRIATKLEAGPLYHHIGQLRLAGLILPKQRDLYELTRSGRNLVLVAVTMDQLLKDGRRRPLGADA